MEDNENTIKREYHAFHGVAWRSWGDKQPMISFHVSDGRNEATQFLTMEQAEEVIALLQGLMEQAKALPERDDIEVWADDPF